jgi:hypothetical protein
VKYNVDTKEDNSGSPVINLENGYAIGIHTNGHCASLGYNLGTSFYNSSLWTTCNPEIDLTVHQKREAGSELTGTYISRWMGDFTTGSFQDYPVGSSGALIENVIVGSYETFRGKQDRTTSGLIEKYNEWSNYYDIINHREFLIEFGLTELVSQFKQTYSGVTLNNEFPEVPGLNPSGDVIEFKDPWLIDLEDPIYNGTTYRNRGTSALFKSRTAPFYPNYDSYYGSDQYLGLFLNQDPALGLINYSVRSPIQQPQDIYITQTGKYHKFYFYNWSSAGTDPLTQNNIVSGYYETPVVFRSGSATVTANLKGTELSNDQNAFSSNCQKKLVRDSFNNLHKVYTSLGSVWYEKSTNNGATWTLENDGKPLSANESKLPAIDYSGNYIFITWQERYQDSYKIRLAYYQQPYTYLVFHDVYDASYWAIPPPYSDNAAPVIAWAGNRILIAFKFNGIVYRYGYVDCYTPITWYTSEYETWISGTDGNSTNPTIAVRKDGGTTVFHLGWQQSSTAIKYRSLTVNGTILTISAEETPSSGSGFNYNINPSISVRSDGYPALVWVGSTYQGATTQVTVRSKGSGGWLANFWKYGANVNSPTCIPSDISGNIVWSEGNANKYYRPYSIIRILSTVGQYVQISNGTSSLNAVAYRQYSPYDFQTSPNLLTLPKINSAINKCGREEIIAKGEAEFYFILGDIFVGDEVINFPLITDTTNITNTEELNEYMQTNTFTINESSNFTFSIAYGVADSLKALNELTGGSLVQFNIELVDGITNELIGELGDFILDADNIYTCQVQSYQVNTQGLGNRNVKLRINANTNFDGAYYLANILTEEEVLGKRDFEELNISCESIVTSYDLFQNYPNPFNPSTTIKYQIPADGLVTLKIFDVLGAEIKSLVNEQQTAGKHEVKVNASEFASGVYIYQLQVNDFISTKKMLLLK